MKKTYLLPVFTILLLLVIMAGWLFTTPEKADLIGLISTILSALAAMCVAFSFYLQLKEPKVVTQIVELPSAPDMELTRQLATEKVTALVQKIATGSSVEELREILKDLFEQYSIASYRLDYLEPFPEPEKIADKEKEAARWLEGMYQRYNNDWIELFKSCEIPLEKEAKQKMYGFLFSLAIHTMDYIRIFNRDINALSVHQINPAVILGGTSDKETETEVYRRDPTTIPKEVIAIGDLLTEVDADGIDVVIEGYKFK